MDRRWVLGLWEAEVWKKWQDHAKRRRPHSGSPDKTLFPPMLEIPVLTITQVKLRSLPYQPWDQTVSPNPVEPCGASWKSIKKIMKL